MRRNAENGTRTRQGDYAFLGLCEQLGARVTRNADSTVIEGPRTLDAAFDATVVLAMRVAGRERR